ncbi:MULTISPECIES: nuclear transport factor 2 family protein [Silvimonas]|uniref:nuclear transport factor 2 family protein n=1 Tax=Silvimonas TaxID=300264 RepID=UPI0024B39DDF|nr:MULTISPECIES: nuclear transport factor 2 family protein [Silvimonas]MDR3427546.1 nuclear transport factor 2 family protein [Silvimonas sp.]
MKPFDGLLDWYCTLTPQSLAQIGLYYRADARFKDPFNDVAGLAAISRVFAHMFETTQTPHFVIREVLADADRGFVTWDFDFGLKGTRYQVHGATRFLFDDTGKVIDHRDYWDVAEELWQKLPLIGAPIGWLRGRFRAQ